MSEKREYDLLDPETYAKAPFELYTYLREEEPLYWDSHNEIWAVSRYEDVVAVSADTETFTSAEGALPLLPPDPSMIHQEPAQHTKQRTLVSSAFTPSAMRKIEENVRAICVEQIEEMKPLGKCDLLRGVARTLPLRVIGDMMGHPREDHEKIVSWTDCMVVGGSGPMSVTDEVNEAFGEFCEYHEEAIAKREAERTDDFLSVWLDARIDGEGLDEGQLLFEHALLFVGGSETTRNVIADAVHQLILHPDQRQYLIDNLDDEEVLDKAIEEMIRWAVPFIRMVRTATRDVEMHGKTIEEGQEVMMMYPAALRDPRVFDNADRWDIKRTPPKGQLAFGHGRHLCLGHNLARMELRIFLQELLTRIPDFELDPDQPIEHSKSSFIRGMSSLPIVWEV